VGDDKQWETKMTDAGKEVQQGDTVLFVAGMNHSRDRNAAGVLIFEFVHEHNSPNSAVHYKKGDLANLAQLGSLDGAKYNQATHCLQTAGGHIVRATKPKAHWQATVLAVGADGKLDLRIQHPHGHILEYPGVPFSASCDPHSWHFSETI